MYFIESDAVYIIKYFKKYAPQEIKDMQVEFGTVRMVQDMTILFNWGVNYIRDYIIENGYF